MALDENQAKIATILYEYEETKKRHALKRAEIGRVATAFAELGLLLGQNPLSVYFTGDRVPMEFAANRRSFEPNEFDVDRLRASLAEFRELELKQARLAKERTSLGYSS